MYLNMRHSLYSVRKQGIVFYLKMRLLIKLLITASLVVGANVVPRAKQTPTQIHLHNHDN